jgi:hypothetical protein
VKLGVPHSMLNVAVAEVGLQGAGVMALVRQGITAGVPKHVRVCLEDQFGLPARPFDPPAKTMPIPAAPNKTAKPVQTPAADAVAGIPRGRISNSRLHLEREIARDNTPAGNIPCFNR